MTANRQSFTAATVARLSSPCTRAWRTGIWRAWALFVLAMVLSPCVAAQETGDAAGPLEAFTQPYRDIMVGAAVTNRVIEVRAEPGERVKRGQVLVRLDDAVLKAAVRVARRAAVATGELEAARHAYQARQVRLEQLEGLFQRKHATEQEVFAARVARDEAAARMKAHEELNERRRAELEQAEQQLARATITSPIDGIVVECVKDIGQVVSAADPHLVRVVQLDPLRIVTSGSAAQVGQLRPGMKLPVLVGATVYEAIVEFVSPVVEVRSGERVVKLRLPNPNLKIAGGIPVTIDLDVAASRYEFDLQQTGRQRQVERR